MAMLDNIIVYKILKLLVTPWKDTEAFKLGIIDDKGKLLKNYTDLKTNEEKEALNVFNRLIFNMKRIIEKIPGGSSKLGSLTAAYFLIKEHLNRDDEIPYNVLEEQFMEIVYMESMLVEETVEILTFLETMENEINIDEEDGTAPANVTGPLTSTDEPVIKKKKRLQDIK